MPSPRRPRIGQRRPGLRPAMPLGQGNDVNQALMALLPGIARMASDGQAAAPRPHVPASAAPEKCRLEMPAGDFRAWKNSMDWWLRLNQWEASDAAGHNRLLCSAELQRAIDTRYSVLQWSMLSPPDALEAIKNITVQPSNKAAEWDKFFSNKQGPSENVNTYFTRSNQVVADCEFSCPRCRGDLGDYLLLKKIMVGLANTSLRKEVFRQCETFGDVNALRMFCVAYESAMKDSVVVGFGVEAGAAATDDVTGVAQGEHDVAAAYRHQHHNRRNAPPPTRNTTHQCGWCGRTHAAGRHNCPARNEECDFCKQVGHFEKVCRKKKQNKSESVISGAVVAATSSQLAQPTVTVNIHHSVLNTPIQVVAVADTGAMICVAGLATSCKHLV